MLDLDPAVALLQSDDAAGLLRAALTGSPTTEVPGFGAELTSWQYRPGAEVTAGYRVSYSAAGQDVVEYLFATTADVGSPAATVDAGGLRFCIWRHPADPLLPGLAAACDPDQVQRWEGVGPGLTRLDLLGYRPLRRAVLRASGPEGDVFAKVLRPGRVEHLAVRQRFFSDAGLTPALVGRPAPGVLLTPAAPGVSLATLLAGQADPPTPAALIGLLDRLPAGLADLERRPAWAERLDFHAATACQRLPDQAGRVDAVVRVIQHVLDTAPVGPLVPTHGDFYEANVFADGDRLSLIDLDNAGPGRREDDLACLLAHLAVLPALSPGHYAHIPALLDAWTDDFSARVHPAALAARVAAVLLSLVTGGSGDQAAYRLDLAERWARRSMREPSSSGPRSAEPAPASLIRDEEER